MAAVGSTVVAVGTNTVEEEEVNMVEVADMVAATHKVDTVVNIAVVDTVEDLDSDIYILLL